MAAKKQSSLVRRHFRLTRSDGTEVRRAIALEPGFWAALDAIAPGDQLRPLIERCLQGLGPQDTLVSVLRCLALNHFRSRVREIEKPAWDAPAEQRDH